MKSIQLIGDQLTNNGLKEVAESLSNNKLIVFNSDTVLGVMVKASTAGINHLNKFKKRQLDKSYSLIFDSLDQVQEYFLMDTKTTEIVKRNVPGLFTFVVSPSAVVNKKVKAVMHSEKIGFRIPLSKLMRQIVRYCPFPVIATSANLSGKKPVYSIKELALQIKDIEQKIDILIENNANTKNISSTVIDLTQSPYKILRSGSGRLK